MRRYQVVAMPGGFAVAYSNHQGYLVGVSDHGERAPAEREARELNAASRKAHEEKAQAVRRATMLTQLRRCVRVFSDAEAAA